ncbi:MAG: hypothetical protein BGN92_07910 [Sphingobacteriales bacterium 41-5]|nr:MAG: hypothetical protein ABS67_03430 [Niabella sp. SCN 42-15]OJU28228.1 MAG: hypothetical protein BGN92_07910 [Sphingobacteriales bacterium 41-5]
MISIFKKIFRVLSEIHHSVLLILPQAFSKFRVQSYRRRGSYIHPTVILSPNVRITGKFTIEEGSSIAQNCTISGESVGIFVGKNVMIAPNVVIVAFNHGINLTSMPMSMQDYEEAKVIIEDDVWIGANCTIGMGITIGTGSVIGANSFVNRDVKPYSIMGGVPAKLIGSRKK